MWAELSEESREVGQVPSGVAVAVVFDFVVAVVVVVVVVVGVRVIGRREKRRRRGRGHDVLKVIGQILRGEGVMRWRI